MIESVWLFHCAYMRVPGLVMVAGSGLKSVRLPLLCALAVHREQGPLLFDASFGPRGPLNLGGALGRALRLAGMAFKPEWSIPERVRELGFEPEALQHVFLTHLHYDHTGALPSLGTTRCHISDEEWAFATGSGLSAGYARGDYHALGERVALFGEAPRLGQGMPGLDLLGDGSVQAFATPGHSAGHTSFRVRLADGRHVLFGGDVAFTTGQILEGQGLGWMPRTSALELELVQRSILDVRAHLASHPDDLLVVSHDPELGARCIDQGPVQL
ncbi:hypothetical protein DL240_13265 [Lujinxingia litoralis]|uniref:Metallo-beta-lactamase domain-containing protein n=1 Tax=Lujinxingia litoralis TaxID=2211119 RepID=A0A328C5G0_9DELT|nr:MBL fold metallo-hydrolase [Lujinxingia litoralis]RAL21815.1 hypothetical protein DL240_13265 [Lujinxingia litoralis]